MIYHFDDLSFQILTIDQFSHREGFFDVKARPYAALSFRLSGTGAFMIGNKQLITRTGDVLFLPANMAYQVEYSVSESIVVHFKSCNYEEAENISFQNASSMEQMFRLLLERWKEAHGVNQAKSMIYEILEKMEKEQTDAIGDEAFARCVRYINAHFCEAELNIQKVCKYGFISASGLQRGFAKYFQISPKQYLLRLRMNRALELLKENELSVSEIAAACGFTDEKYFSRAFKKKYGCPPSHMKKNMFL